MATDEINVKVNNGTFSYDPLQLQDNPIYQVRLRVGDTEEAGALLADEEILYLLGYNSNVEKASYLAVNSMIAKLTQLPEYTLGPYTEKHDKRLEQLRLLQRELEKEFGGLGIPMMCSPTTAPVFSYDFMSVHCCDKEDDNFE